MTPVSTPKQCDLECDVLVIGAGAAGLPAAIAVAEAGFKPLVLEARPKAGGSLAMVVGAFAVPGTDEQKAAGIKDSPDLCYNDLIRVCEADPEIARAFVDNVLDVYKILKEEGIVWPGLVDLPGQSATRAFGWLLGYGPKIVACFQKRLDKLGVKTLYKHRGHRLTVDPATGRVNGAIVLDGEKKKFIKAKMGVILGTGGFLHNPEMVGEYDPSMLKAIPKMPVSHQGDGHKMAFELGAATKDIGIAVAGSWPLCTETHSRCIWALDWGGIMVNKFAKRFYNEGSVEGFYGYMTRAAMNQPDGVYFVILDGQVENEIGTCKIGGEISRNMEHVKDLEQCKKQYASTPEELAKKLGLDPAAFAATIAKYNGDIEKYGYDTEFQRKFQMGEARPIHTLKAPFIGIRAVTATTSAKGGIKINGKCQVINQFGEAIPGLYAGGELTGGLWHKSYLLGIMSSGCCTQGYLAGKNIVKEAAEIAASKKTVAAGAVR
jgi:fumarate reductase flavoprotein subunit